MPEIPPGLHLKGTPSAPRGRSLTAARPFAPGAAIALFGSPSIAIPDSSSLHEVCNHCLLPRGGVGGADAGADAPVVRACTGCRTVTYCGPACQKADWALVHKGECKVFKRVRAEGHDFLPTSVRALVQMHLREDMRAAAAEMEGHVEEFRAQKEVWRNMELQAMAALHYLGQEANPGSVGMAVEMLCKLQVNSFSRLDQDIEQTGMFISPALAMVNHSCTPNAFVQFIGRKAVLRAYQAIKEGDEVEISYTDYNLHRSRRQKDLKEQWHFDCGCPRCRDDMDVYQVCQLYPHLELNAFSLNPDLSVFRNPSNQGSFNSNQILQKLVEKIYPVCSTPLSGLSSSEDPAQILRNRWHLCEPLRKAKLFAIEPLPHVMGGASIYLGERGDYAASLALSCFLALNSDAPKSPMPFNPTRVKGLLMIANLLSNTAPISASGAPSPGASVAARLARALRGMDQATMSQAVLSVAARWAPMAHSDGWRVLRDAGEQLRDIESLPGRDKEKALVQVWAADPGDLEGKLFFEYAVLNPVREIAGFALEVMDTEFGPRQGLIRSQ